MFFRELQADSLAGRQGPNDADYVFSVLKLLHRVGTSGGKGHGCVMRVKESWKHIHSKFVKHKRSGGGGQSISFAPAASPAAHSKHYFPSDS